MDDSGIIGLFFERSERAVTELERKYGPAALRLAANILGDGRDAEECVSDAYLAVWNAIADQTGLAPRRISVRLFRLREKLKKRLEKEGLMP